MPKLFLSVPGGEFSEWKNSEEFFVEENFPIVVVGWGGGVGETVLNHAMRDCVIFSNCTIEFPDLNIYF